MSELELRTAAARLGEAAMERIVAMFAPTQRAAVMLLLVRECGEAVPMADAPTLERVRMACLKLCDGEVARLREAVELAKVDWRDVLVAAGFAHDTTAHLRWMP